MTELSLLVDECLAGDDSAARQFIDRFRAKVYALCLRMVGEHHEAEDMAQETFLRVFRHLDRWDRERPLEPWILTIAGNRCRTHIAQRSRRVTSSLAEESVPDHRADPHVVKQLAEEVHLALQDSRSDYRQAFLLFHDHQLSYQQIAEELNCPVGTVKTWVHRARAEIVRRLVARGVVQETTYDVRRV